MIRVGVLGAGSHSRREHLPSLRLYRERHPEGVELTALCDPTVNLAKEFGFQQHCEHLDHLLELRPDAIIAVTPVQVTAAVALRVIRAGIPLLMEKPLGSTVAESVEVVAAAEGRPVMVSMNRRFDPALVAMAKALQSRSITHLRAVMERVGRVPEGFLEDAGVHALDVLRMLAGECASVQGTPECLRLTFKNGVMGTLELYPNGGRWEESYDAYGPGFHVQALATRSCRMWVNGKQVLEVAGSADDPSFVRSGTYGETAAFLESVASGAALSPSPAEVMESVEITHFGTEQADRCGEAAPDLCAGGVVLKRSFSTTCPKAVALHT